MDNEKLKANPYEIIEEHEQKLTGFDKFKWYIYCLIDDIEIWITCKWYKIMSKLFPWKYTSGKDLMKLMDKIIENDPEIQKEIEKLEKRDREDK